MDRYQVAEKETGPWLEMVVTNRPEQALAKARASFNWDTVWVAKMRPIMGEDLLPTPEVFWADVVEEMATKYGSTVADEVSMIANANTYEYVALALTGALLDAEVEILVPMKTWRYKKDEAVKAIHFMGADEAVTRMQERVEEKTKPKADLKALLEKGDE